MLQLPSVFYITNNKLKQYASKKKKKISLSLHLQPNDMVNIIFILPCIFPLIAKSLGTQSWF